MDNDAPSVIISSTAGSVTNISPIPATAVFSESIYGFEAEDIAVTNGSVTPRSFSGSGTTYNFTITPAGEGDVMVDIAANVAWDLVGNYNSEATQFSINYDSVAPMLTAVSIVSNNGDSTLAKIGDTITLSFSVSEPIQEMPNVTIAGHTGVGLEYIGNDWTATTEMLAGDSEGVVSFTIDFLDLAGNSGEQATPKASSRFICKTLMPQGIPVVLI